MKFHDFFAGVGGSSTGLRAAGLTGVVALNHWDYAIELHNANHPDMDHDQADIWKADPRRYRPAEIGWFSPECRAHSQAKGKKRYGQHYETDLWRNPTTDPADDRSRLLMESVPYVSSIAGYKYVLVENVTEVVNWLHFNRWLKEMEKLDYQWKLLFLNSQFFGTPQSRDRFFGVFWKRGMPVPNLDFKPRAVCSRCGLIEAQQAWKPNRWHGRYGKQYIYVCPHCTHPVEPFTTGAETAIDWTLPITRIGDRPGGLSKLTLQKIEYGLKRFAAERLIIDTAYTHAPNKARPVDQPLFTQTTQQSLALTVSYYGRENAVKPAAQPLPTVPTENKIGVAVITGHYSRETAASDAAEPTVSTVAKHGLVMPQVNIEDVLFRMLKPRELASGTGFPTDYILYGSQKNQTRGIGGAVDPNVAAWLGSRILQAVQS